MKQKNSTPHIPVLLNDILEHLKPEASVSLGLLPFANKLVVDCTFGAGGYSRAFLEQGANVIAIDRDPSVMPQAKLLADQYQDKFKFINSSFSQLAELDIQAPDIIVLDLGVSSMQIDQAERGFSFQKDGPLDMRMAAEGLTAAEVVNNFSVGDLNRIFRTFGEEKRAASIARMIVKKRELQPFTTTAELSDAIATLFPRRHFEKIHPATRVFQALRIYVNSELSELALALIAAEKLLPPGGKLGVVSFHSLEDRIVKQFLMQCSVAPAVSRYLPLGEPFNPSFILRRKQLIIASLEETLQNPRARSAKLRVAVRSSAEALCHKEVTFNVPGLPAKL